MKEESRFIELGTIDYRYPDGSTESYPLYIKAREGQKVEDLAKALLRTMKGGTNEAHSNN